jgi:hypothetical protein
MPAASLGHYASLSFVVIGRSQREDFGLRIAELKVSGFSVQVSASIVLFPDTCLPRRSP